MMTLNSESEKMFDFKLYRQHLLVKNGIDGIKLMKLCITDPIHVGELIYRTLADLYPDNLKTACKEFKAPMPIYMIEERALKKYLETLTVKEEDEDGKEEGREQADL